MWQQSSNISPSHSSSVRRHIVHPNTKQLLSRAASSLSSTRGLTTSTSHAYRLTSFTTQHRQDPTPNGGVAPPPSNNPPIHLPRFLRPCRQVTPKTIKSAPLEAIIPSLHLATTAIRTECGAFQTGNGALVASPTSTTLTEASANQAHRERTTTEHTVFGITPMDAFLPAAFTPPMDPQVTPTPTFSLPWNETNYNTNPIFITSPTHIAFLDNVFFDSDAEDTEVIDIPPPIVPSSLNTSYPLTSRTTFTTPSPPLISLSPPPFLYNEKDRKYLELPGVHNDLPLKGHVTRDPSIPRDIRRSICSSGPKTSHGCKIHAQGLCPLSELRPPISEHLSNSPH